MFFLKVNILSSHILSSFFRNIVSMSLDSSPSPPLPMSTLDRRPALSYHRKPLKSTLSHSDNGPPTRRSLKLNKTESVAHSQSRPRTMSVSDDLADDTLADLPPSTSNTLPPHDRRNSEIKPIPNRHNQVTADRRNSTPQIHFSSLLPHAFRPTRHHNKHAPK